MTEGTPNGGGHQESIADYTPTQIERLRHEAQILKETGISANYFNDMYLYRRIEVRRVLHPEIKVQRFEYDDPAETAAHEVRNEKWIRDRVAESLPKVRTYSEYIEQYRNGMPKEIFVTDRETERVRQMDEKVLEMRSLIRENPQDIDLARLNQLAYEVSCLIYGEDRHEGLKKSFLELDEGE